MRLGLGRGRVRDRGRVRGIGRVDSPDVAPCVHQQFFSGAREGRSGVFVLFPCNY